MDTSGLFVTFYVLLLLICDVLSCLLLGRWRLVVRWMSREIRSLPCQLRSSSQINILMGEKCQTHTPPLTRVSNGKILQKQQFCYFVVMCFNFSNGARPEGACMRSEEKKPFSYLIFPNVCSLSKKTGLMSLD